MHVGGLLTGIRGQVRWSRSYFDATGLDLNQVSAELNVVANRVDLVPQDPPFAPMERLVPLQSAALTALHQDGDDFVVHYEAADLGVGVPLRITVSAGAAFHGTGLLRVSQMGGASTVSLSQDAPWAEGVDFRITFFVLH